MEYLEDYMKYLQEEHKYLYSRLLFEDIDFKTRTDLYIRFLETKVAYYKIKAETTPNSFVELHLN